jgi:hypothetical protein
MTVVCMLYWSDTPTKLASFDFTHAPPLERDFS